jgi:hypothetical protein
VAPPSVLCPVRRRQCCGFVVVVCVCVCGRGGGACVATRAPHALGHSQAPPTSTWLLGPPPPCPAPPLFHCCRRWVLFATCGSQRRARTRYRCPCSPPRCRQPRVPPPRAAAVAASRPPPAPRQPSPRELAARGVSACPARPPWARRPPACPPPRPPVPTPTSAPSPWPCITTPSPPRGARPRWPRTSWWLRRCCACCAHHATPCYMHSPLLPDPPPFPLLQNGAFVLCPFAPPAPPSNPIRLVLFGTPTNACSYPPPLLHARTHTNAPTSRDCVLPATICPETR